MLNSTKIQQLRLLLDEHKFHHATYRDQGRLWEGLFIYPNDPNGFCGYGGPCLVFGKEDLDLSAAQDMVKHLGTSLGAYGKG